MNWKEPEWVKEKDNKFELSGVTLYGGKGKNRPIIINQNELSDIQNKHEGTREDHTMKDTEPVYDGLSQPRLNNTDEVFGPQQEKNAQRKQATQAS